MDHRAAAHGIAIASPRGVSAYGIVHLLILASLLSPAGFAGGETTLSLGQYLRQVKLGNAEFRGEVEQREGAKDRIQQARLFFTPSFFADARYESDAKLPILPLWEYDRLISQNYSLGISEQFSFGLRTRLFYALDYTSYEGVNLGPFGALAAGIPLAFYDARPVVELSLPLWGGGFGSSARASQEATRSQSEADSFSAESSLRTLLSQAERAYWRVAVSDQVVKIREKTLAAARTMDEYNKRRARLRLVEPSDVLQSHAAFLSRTVDLKAALERRRAAIRAFNSLRNADLDEDPGKLESIQWKELEKISLPANWPLPRADVRAAEAQSRVAQANSRIQIERDKPSLEIYANYALNGRDPFSPGAAIADPFSAYRPTQVYGVRFSLPLDLGAASDARRGSAKQERAAELIYEQRWIEQGQQWKDLAERLRDAKDRLNVAEEAEAAERKKLEHARLFLKRGRSSTFQVLQFEQDYLHSELSRVEAGAELLLVRSELRLYQASGQGAGP